MTAYAMDEMTWFESQIEYDPSCVDHAFHDDNCTACYMRVEHAQNQTNPNASGHVTYRFEDSCQDCAAVGELLQVLPADDTPTCDRCGQECGEENLTAQSNGQSICGACEFNDDD